MAGSFGAFGKIPALGDFFRLNVTQDFVSAWDDWLQHALVAARTRLGADWQDRYMSAPIWRFSLSPGLAGREAVIGVMMPSVDRVGRQFPLTLVSAVPTYAPLRTLALQDTVFAALEDIALDALDDDATQERIGKALEALVLAPALPYSTIQTRGSGYMVSSPAAEALLADLALRLGPNPASVCSAALAGSAWLLAGHSLPDASQTAALFDLSAPMWSEGSQ
jgi:type VI secretion system protein ImpM